MVEPNEDNTAWRRVLRREMVARRAALSDAEHAGLSARIVEHLLASLPVPGMVAFCWPIKHEPDVRAVVERWAVSCGRTRSCCRSMVLTRPVIGWVTAVVFSTGHWRRSPLVRWRLVLASRSTVWSAFGRKARISGWIGLLLKQGWSGRCLSRPYAILLPDAGGRLQSTN